MLKSRRGLLAAGLAVAVVGALGVASTLNAGAGQITGGSGQPVAEAAPVDPNALAGTATPPSVLPWGQRPERVRKGRAGATSRTLRAEGDDAAANDTSGSTQPRGRYAPKGRWSKTGYLKTEVTDVAPPEPPAGASPTAEADPTEDPTTAATTDPTTDPTDEATTAATDEPTAETTTDAAQPEATESTADAAPGQEPEPAASSSGHVAPEPSGASTTSDKAYFLYNTGMQYAETDGFYTNVSIAKPALTRGDYHTLGELALQSADGKQIVEVGWNVDRLVNGDDDPHLFVYHWVNRTPSCYNGCGFVQYSKNIKPGDTLATDTIKKFGIQYFNGAWWIAFDSEWIGYFPEQLWNDEGIKFSRSGLIQVFGEVAASSLTPCSQMGNGLSINPEKPTDPSGAAYMASVAFLNGPAVNLTYQTTDAARYPIVGRSSRTFQYGGPVKAC
ncbi:neprosin family prolyl endopeptidase [Actinoplanes sp. CA-030573]|uniref:neprosin family prolyl endopeptidase n=1 Tax=Actinoplanes sp. CA-030573 TaxID=3239898 RepID=UPI003D92B9D3